MRLKRIAAGSAAGALVGLALGAWLWSLDAAVVAAAGLTASIVVWLLWAGFEIVSASDDEPAGEFASPAHDADGPPEFVDTDAIWYTP